jgi:uncharacterized ubiquitin-like protein YukD
MLINSGIFDLRIKAETKIKLLIEIRYLRFKISLVNKEKF